MRSAARSRTTTSRDRTSNMGPAHRRADSRRSARKNSGYTPWHLLPAAAREAKRKRPSRTPAKKRRAPPAPARSPSPTRRQPLPPVGSCSARWPPRCCCSTLLAVPRCSSRALARQRRQCPRRGAPATASAGATHPLWMGPCVLGVFLPTTRCAGGRASTRASASGLYLMRPSGVPRGRSTLV